MMGIPVCDIFGNNQKKGGDDMALHPPLAYNSTLPNILSPLFSKLFLHPHLTKSSLPKSCLHGNHLPLHEHNDLLPSTPTHPQQTMHLSSSTTTSTSSHPPPRASPYGHNLSRRLLHQPYDHIFSGPPLAQMVTLLFRAVAGVFGPVLAWEQYARCDSKTRCWDRSMRDASSEANGGGDSLPEYVMGMRAVPQKGN